jgi:putative phosphoesterase
MSSDIRIGLISDTHIPEAMPTLLPQVFDAFDDCDCILHGGDVHDISVIDQLHAVAPTYVARGNGDDGSGGRAVLADDPRLNDVWTLDLGGLTVGLIHDIPVPENPPHHTMRWALDRYFPDRTPDVIVHGDTHVESIMTLEDVLCVNPGSPTYPHNLRLQLGTIGFLDIRNGQPHASIWRLTETGIEPFVWDTWGRPW